MPFPGFTPLDANFLYCPNQFFDVCLWQSSRGVVRLVAYLLRRTLGWLDEHGDPIEQNVAVSYREFVEQAGISRGAIRQAVNDAIAAGFIVCTRPGTADGLMRPAVTAQYSLRWDSGNEYAKSLDTFDGFFAGDGHRTPIPNAFFDQIVSTEPLTVVKVIGAVLRHTVGYQNQFGGRRSQAPLSYRYIQRYANVSDRSSLAQALRRAVERGYVRCVEAGYFHADQTKRRAASYAVNWLTQAECQPTSSKTRPATPNRFKNQTSTSPKTRPVDRFKNQTKENTPSNNTIKQQQQAAAVTNKKPYHLLREVGFDHSAAVHLCRLDIKTPGRIERQIEWLPNRHPRDNHLGMLRRSIEDDWPEPAVVEQQRQRQHVQQHASKRHAEQAAILQQGQEMRQARTSRRQALLAAWRECTAEERSRYHLAAIATAPSETVRRRLRRHTDLDEPPTESLHQFALHCRDGAGDSEPSHPCKPFIHSQ